MIKGNQRRNRARSMSDLKVEISQWTVRSKSFIQSGSGSCGMRS